MLHYIITHYIITTSSKKQASMATDRVTQPTLFLWLAALKERKLAGEGAVNLTNTTQDSQEQRIQTMLYTRKSKLCATSRAVYEAFAAFALVVYISGLVLFRNC